MKLKVLTLQNFLSIKSAELSLDNKGLVMIQGVNCDDKNFDNNGSGKSSIIEGVVYALFGKTVRGLVGDSVVNRVVSKNMKVTLELEDDDGTQYKILRFRKHYENKNQSLLFRNGVNVTPKSEKDFNIFIEKLLQMDFLTFTSSILYSEHSFKFSTATDSELKGAFDTMLGFEFLNACQEKAKELHKSKVFDLQMLDRNNKQSQDLLESYEGDEVVFSRNIQTEAEETKLKVSAKREVMENLLASSTEVSGELKHLDEEIESASALVVSLEKELEQLKTDNLKARDDVKALSDEIIKVNRDISGWEGKLEANSSKISSAERTLKRLVKDSKTLGDKIQSTLQTVGEPCVTCGSPISKDKIQVVVAELRKQKRQIDIESEDVEEELEGLEEEGKRLRGLIDNWSESGRVLQKLKKKAEMEGNSDKQDECQARLSKAIKALANLEGTKRTMELKRSMGLEKLKEVEGEIAVLENKKSLWEPKLEELRVKIKSLRSELESYLETRLGLEKEISQLIFWVDAFGQKGIKSLLLDDVTPFLNRRVNKYLQFLTDDSIEVKFTTQQALKSGEMRDKFGVTVLNKLGGDAYIGNSGGERKRIDLAISLALQDLVASRSTKKLNIVFYDEVFDMLDQTGVERAVALIQETSQSRESVFVITHNAEMKSYFDKIITVTKSGGQSTITQN